MARDNAEIDVLYITERILVLTFPNTGTESAYKSSLKEVSQMLRTKHGTNYKVFNVSKKRGDLTKYNSNVVDFGWPEELAPPLEKLCAICKEIEHWLASDSHNVIVVHSKGGRARPAIIVSAYMHYTNVCASDDQALDRFAMRRFSDDYGSAIAQPSHRRYVRYFSALLSGSTKINSNPIFLHHLTVTDLPDFGQQAGCRPIIKIYEKMESVYSSGVFTVDQPPNNRLNIRFSPAISLRGDVLVKCFHKNAAGAAAIGAFPLLPPSSTTNQRRVVFRCQFNTCALDFDDGFKTNRLVFDADELDDITDDRTTNTELVLWFSLSAEPSDLKLEPALTPISENLVRTDSYENFEYTNEDSDSANDAGGEGQSSEFDNVSHTKLVSVDTTAYDGQDTSASVGASPADIGGREAPSSLLNGGQRQEAPPQLYASIRKQPNESADSGIGSDLSATTTTAPRHNNGPPPLVNGVIGEDEDDDLILPVTTAYQHQRATIKPASDLSQPVGSDAESYQQRSATIHSSAPTKQYKHPPHLGPPTPPPKPRGALVSDSPHKPHGILPAGVTRPFSPSSSSETSHQRAGSPDGQQQPSIDVGLVGKDRYDPASKAFSYVPKGAIERHFQSPKKETQLVRRFEDSHGREITFDSTPAQQPPSASATLPARSTAAVDHRAYDDLQQQSPADYQTMPSPEHKPRSPQKARRPPPHHDIDEPPVDISEPSAQYPAPVYERTSSFGDDDVVDEAAPAASSRPKSRNKKNRSYNKYKTLDEYESDMDDLCDPDFYLSFDATTPTEPPSALTRKPDSPQSSVRRQARPPSAQQHDTTPPPDPVGSQSAELPRRHIPPPPPPPQSPPSSTIVRRQPPPAYANHRSSDLTGMSSARRPTDDSDGAPPPLPPRSAPAVRPAASWANALEDDQQFADIGTFAAGRHHQSSRSVTNTPVAVRHRQAATSTDANQRFSFSTDIDPDAWLENQLEKLKIRKEMNDPDRRRRKEQEKMLLEELKNVNDDRMAARGRNEAEYTVEGVGTKTVDPNDEYRREQQRLNALQSPTSPQKVVGMRKSRDSHGGGGGGATTPTMQHPYVGARKPPTPPPRERSRTPPGSPRRGSPVTVANRRASATSGRNTPPKQQQQQSYPQQQQQYVEQQTSYRLQLDDSVDSSRQSADDRGGGGDFDHLEQLVWNDDSGRSGGGGRSSGGTASQLRRTDSQQSADGGGQQQYYGRGVQPSPKSILKKPRSLHTNGGGRGDSFNDYASDADESVASYRRQASAPVYASVNNDPNRAETPSFPLGGRDRTTPVHPLLYNGAEEDPRSPGQARTPVTYQRPMQYHSMQYRSPSPGSMYYGQSRRSSVTSIEPMEVIHHHPVFVKDTSKFWYKAKISREEAITLLKDKSPGTFIIRDSNSFPGAFGLALKVATPPPGVQPRSGDGTELVRHFLIEPSAKGVKLKGCNNEPVFGTLSALVYQHSITPLALPAKLVLPEYDPAAGPEPNQAMELLQAGAACNVMYIHSCDTESLTGPEAVRRVVEQALQLRSSGAQQKTLQPISVHFKASAQGITVTDNTRKLFFRRHYPVHSITYCGSDPELRTWTNTPSPTDAEDVVRDAQMFGFVARKIASSTDNACHIFAELEPKQPSTAIVNFITRVVLAQGGGQPGSNTGSKAGDYSHR